MKKKISIGSLDFFHMPRLQAGLASEYDTDFFSTWSLRRDPPNPDLKSYNNWVLHYLLLAYKISPQLQFRNYSYTILCKIFDEWFTSKIKSDMDMLCFLSGFGTKAMRQAHAWRKPVVVDSGSTHTDFQHRIVSEEYRRNGLHHTLFPKNYRDRIRLEFAEADFIQIPSEFVRRTYLEAGIPEGKLLKANYGSDVHRFQSKSISDVSPVFRVICPSGVNLRKGARLLVEAWRKLGWNAGEAELHWIGSPDHPDVRHLFTDPLKGVFWHNWMPHEKLCELYQSCDVLVLPSFEEGLARVLIEGAASGLALIATPNTGVEDFFSAEIKEGWLIPANCVDSICCAIEEARSNRLRTFEMGQEAAGRARQGFSWDHYGHQVRANFKFILAK